MSDKAKKILMVVGFIAIVVLLAFLIWYVFFRKPTITPTPPITEGEGGAIVEGNLANLPISTYGSGITIVIDNSAYGTYGVSENLSNMTIEEIMEKYRNQDLKNVNEIETVPEKNTNIPLNVSDVANGGPTRTSIIALGNNVAPVISGNNLISFNPDDGMFYKLNLDTNEKNPLTSDTFKGASNIIWAPTNDKAVIEFPDGSNVVYDFNKDKQYVLPKDWYDFSFQKDGNKLAFMIDSNNYENRWLAISNIDGSGLTGIEPLGNNADKVDVMYSPNEQMVALSRTGEPIGMFQQSVLLIGLHGENFNDLKIEGRGYHPLWSPAGDKVVYDAYNQDTAYKPNIWVINATSDTAGIGSRSLGLNTWVSKCGFSSDGKLLYCAVPREMPEGAGMFPEMMDDAKIADDIYVVNIYTGYKKLVAQPNIDVTISKVFLNSDNSILYYQEKDTGNIYSIKLK